MPADIFIQETGGKYTIDNRDGHLTTFGYKPAAVAAQANVNNVVATGDDMTMLLTFGTGATPVAGAVINATFARPFAVGTTPLVAPSPQNALTGNIGPWVVDLVTNAGFTLRCIGTPLANQAAGTYAVGVKIQAFGPNSQ